MPDGISAFDPQHPHVVDFFRFAAGFLDAVQEALCAEKVFLRHLLGESEQECAITAAKIDMQRRCAAEDFLQIERREI
ncbi:MAG: hypothetical protein QOE73_1340 [Verrucomicrobiota bacterium]